MALRLKPAIILTTPMLEQMDTYRDYYEREGCYYGNKQQFVKRAELIRQWIQDEIEEVKRRNPSRHAGPKGTK